MTVVRCMKCFGAYVVSSYNALTIAIYCLCIYPSVNDSCRPFLIEAELDLVIARFFIYY